MGDFIGDRDCVTHHYACDCREAAHKAQVARLEGEVAAAAKIVSILKANGMNLGVVQVPPPIHDHDRLYALKDAVAAFDAALSDTGKGMDAETAKVFVEGIAAEHDERHPGGD